MAGHGGNIGLLALKAGCRPEEILDFSANINPLGPPDFLHALITAHIPDLIHYPDPESGRLITRIGGYFHLDPGQIVVGNGTSELLFRIPHLLQPKRAVIPVPAYIDYEAACRVAGVDVDLFPLLLNDNFRLDLDRLSVRLQGGELVIIGQPNNPTGCLLDRAQLLDCIQHHPDVFFVIDEAFAGFLPEYQTIAGCADNLIVLYSLTKIFAIPGLRLGFLSASVDICRKLRAQAAPWQVNGPAQLVGEACLAPAGETWGTVFSAHDYLKKSYNLIAAERDYLYSSLSKLQYLQPVPSTVNFILLRLDHPGLSALRLAEILLKQYRIAIRPCDNYQALDEHYFRIAVKTREENEQLIQALQAIMHAGMTGEKQRNQPDGTKITNNNNSREENTDNKKNTENKKNKKKIKKIKKTPALMLLGTGSDVGKSVLVAALCRILLQDGVRVAPFKAQNMSLNSYVTRDGGEMGRAQVVQAQACRLDPDVRMNPVLLKPSSDVGSQVIVMGKPVANMNVRDYVAYKKTAWQQVCAAYDSLAGEHDVVLLEGAGSPGEVNLKAHDIVNTKMARYAEARALLVGDIDRGGVYASFIGHFAVMEPWERELLAGFVVNRFRGDAGLLGDAHAYLAGHTGKPIFGVIDYIPDLGLPQEDSVGFKAGIFSGDRPAGEHVEVVLIDLPHISNFTDIEPLLLEKDVHVRIVSDIDNDNPGSADAIILPGSKNVPADLKFLQAAGLGQAIQRAVARGVEVVGICGGFQLLGREITDPHGLETSAGARCAGLGLLNMKTELGAEKTLTRKQGHHRSSGMGVYGYEIHHGISRGNGEPVFSFDDGSVCGLDNGEGVWGVYLHGLFDSDGFRRWWINELRRKKGLPAADRGAVYDLEPALDRVAALVREKLTMDSIYQLLGL